jgi:hypothetical protein
VGERLAIGDDSIPSRNVGGSRREHDQAEIFCLPAPAPAPALSHTNPRICRKLVVGRQYPDIEVNEDENVEEVGEMMEKRREGESGFVTGTLGFWLFTNSASRRDAIDPGRSCHAWACACACAYACSSGDEKMTERDNQKQSQMRYGGVLFVCFFWNLDAVEEGAPPRPVRSYFMRSGPRCSVPVNFGVSILFLLRFPCMHLVVLL